MPEVTIVLPVCHVKENIDEAINSILQQSFEDFELYLIDEGATDDVSDLLHSYQDLRTSVVRGDSDRISNLNRSLGMPEVTITH